jgi:hypothetical protein
MNFKKYSDEIVAAMPLGLVALIGILAALHVASCDFGLSTSL